MMKPTITVLSLALGASALEMAAPKPRFMTFRNQDDNMDLNTRFLQLDENSQCFIDTKAIGEQIEARGIEVTAHANCDNTNFCQAHASDDPDYDDFLQACDDLNGNLVTYHMGCNFVISHDAGSDSVNMRWNDLVVCFAQSCSKEDIVETVTDYDFTITDSTGGARVTSSVCTVEDVTSGDGTVIVSQQQVDVDVTSGASSRFWVMSAAPIALLVVMGQFML